jgi:hypothetical protein
MDQFVKAFVKASLAWLALTEPTGWTDADTRRLKSLFAAYRR